MVCYFDHNATTPLAAAAKEAWLEVVDAHWMNPSSPYRSAAAVHARLESARAGMTELFGVAAGRMVFTSGATESNNAVFRHFSRMLPKGAFVGVCATEHPSVIEAAKFYFRDRVVWLPVGSDGLVNLSFLEEQIKAGKLSLVSVMAANNETGVLPPWREIAQLCSQAGVPYHCDASQWVGKMSLDGLAGCSYVTACAHKFGGPKGVGLLLLPAGEDALRMQVGGAQESGHRGGTEDVPGVLAMHAALLAARPQSGSGRDQFEDEMRSRLSGVKVVGEGVKRLWNTTSIILPQFQSVRWVRALEKKGFLVSSGSACATGKSGVSHVLSAMEVGSDEAGRVLRISSGFDTNAEDWAALVDAIVDVRESLMADAEGSPSNVISID